MILVSRLVLPSSFISSRHLLFFYLVLLSVVRKMVGSLSFSTSSYSHLCTRLRPFVPLERALSSFLLHTNDYCFLLFSSQATFLFNQTGSRWTVRPRDAGSRLPAAGRCPPDRTVHLNVNVERTDDSLGCFNFSSFTRTCFFSFFLLLLHFFIFDLLPLFHRRRSSPRGVRMRRFHLLTLHPVSTGRFLFSGIVDSNGSSAFAFCHAFFLSLSISVSPIPHRLRTIPRRVITLLLGA